MRRILCLLASLGLSCSSGAPPRGTEESAAREPEAHIAPAASSDRETPAPTQDGADTVAVLRFAEDARPRIESLTTGTQVEPGTGMENPRDEYDALVAGPTSYPVVEFPEHADALNAQLREQTLSLISRLDEDEHPDGYGRAICRAAVARADLVGMRCSGIVVYNRGGPFEELVTRSYRVIGERLVEFDLHDALLPGATLDDLVRRACRRAADHAEEICEESPGYSDLSISPRGIRIDMGRPIGERFEPLTAYIPWRSLDGLVLADGPLGPALTEYATRTLVPRPTVPPPHGQGFAVSERAHFGTLMHRWASLSEADRAMVRMDALSPDDGQLVVTQDVGRARAEELAAALGATASEARWSSAPLEIVVQETRRDTSLRRGPSRTQWGGAGFVQLPAGAQVLALRGRILRRESALGARGRWALVSPAPAVQGWAAGNLLRAPPGCRVAPDALLDGLPDATRARARRTLILSRVTVFRRGRRSDAVLSAVMVRAHRRRRAIGRARVQLHAIDAQCEVGRRLAIAEADGLLWTANVTHTQASGGETLMVLATAPSSDSRSLRWSLMAQGRRTTERWSGETSENYTPRYARSREDGGFALIELRDSENHVMRVERTDDGFTLRDAP